MAKRRLLLVEDDEGVRFGVRGFFAAQGYDVAEARSVETGIAAFDLQAPEAVIVDFQLPDGDALDLLAILKQRAPDVPVVLLTGFGSVERAVRALQAGADHFLTKPIELPILAAVVERAIENRRLQRRAAAERITNERHRVDPFVGRSAAIRELEREARRVLETEIPVLILGATGTGKGVLASWLHANGPRAREPFLDINCASLSREFLETELFGHRKGAFTGALSDKPGLLEVADGGTVFLDEIGDMDLAVQPKLLKVVEEGRFRRMGEVQDRSADVRLVAATHDDLAALVHERRFREDLYYRINAFPLRVPALRERREDIPLLAPRIAEILGRETGHETVYLAPDAIEAMMDYDWPGNIRELHNVIERALLMSGRPAIEREHLRFEHRPQKCAGAGESAAAATGELPRVPPHDVAPGEAFADLTLDALERVHIIRVFEASGGRVEEAARRLGIPRSTLYHKLREFGIALRR